MKKATIDQFGQGTSSHATEHHIEQKTKDSTGFVKLIIVIWQIMSMFLLSSIGSTSKSWHIQETKLEEF